MATLKTKFSVGIFLIAGMAIVVSAVIWLGMSKYLERGHLFVAYFDESVQGLDKDSPVKYRGVHIGRVYSIGVAPDEKLIQVVMKIESDLPPPHLNETVVAQLKSVGITGLRFIELERRKENERLVYPPKSFKPPYPVVPTRPSEISKIFKGIEDVMATFKNLDTRTISDQLTQILRKVNHTLDAAQLDAMTANMRATLRSFKQTSSSLNQMAVNADGGINDIRATVAHLDGIIGSSGADINQVTANLKESARQIKRAMASATILIQNTDRSVDNMQRQVQVTLNRIEQASETLNRFLDRIAAQPSQLVFSGSAVEKPPAP